MYSIDWNESLTVGVKQFDEHHKYLFDLLNRIHASFWDENRQDDSEAIIDELIAYSAYHFEAEESLLSKLNYDGLSLQEREHRYFTQKVHEFKQDAISGRKVYPIELLWFLGNWLLQHIMEADKRYSAHV